MCGVQFAKLFLCQYKHQKSKHNTPDILLVMEHVGGSISIEEYMDLSIKKSAATSQLPNELVSYIVLTRISGVKCGLKT
jgi:hypothetical protein